MREVSGTWGKDYIYTTYAQWRSRAGGGPMYGVARWDK